MWVVKIGGSLCADPLLPEWLDLLAGLGRGRVTIVCGGGGFADEVRRVQAHWQFSDLAAHNMAVLAMAQYAYQLNAINPALKLTRRKSEIPKLLHRGHTALWLPFELQREQADGQSNWDSTSDSIALDLARQLNAEQLVVVKSCAVDPRLSIDELSRAGVLDRGFAELARQAAFPIDVLHKDGLQRMRSLLLGESRMLAS